MKPNEVVRVKMLERPTYQQSGPDPFDWSYDLGEFEWQTWDDEINERVKFTVNMNDLKKELSKTPFRDRIDEILDRVYSFVTVYLILPTCEITT